MCAMRHMHQHGTTSEQLAWVKVAASHHAQYNEHAMLRDVVTVEDVVNSPMIADPLHRLDCCVISDGGGAIILAAPEIAKSLKRPLVKGDTVKATLNFAHAGAVTVEFPVLGIGAAGPAGGAKGDDMKGMKM